MNKLIGILLLFVSTSVMGTNWLVLHEDDQYLLRADLDTYNYVENSIVIQGTDKKAKQSEIERAAIAPQDCKRGHGEIKLHTLGGQSLRSTAFHMGADVVSTLLAHTLCKLHSRKVRQVDIQMIHEQLVGS